MYWFSQFKLTKPVNTSNDCEWTENVIFKLLYGKQGTLQLTETSIYVLCWGLSYYIVFLNITIGEEIHPVHYQK